MSQLKKKKVLIFVTNNRQIYLARKLRDTLSGPKAELLILGDYNLSLQDKFQIKSLFWYRKCANIKYRDIWKDFRTLFYALIEKEKGSANTFKLLTDYSGISLWEASFAELLFTFAPIMEMVNVLDVVLKMEIPDEVIIFQPAAVQSENIMALLCRTKQIPVRIYKAPSLKRSMFKAPDFLNTAIVVGKKIKRFFVSIHCCIFNLFANVGSKFRPEIIFFNSEERFLETLLPIIKLFSAESRLVINTAIPGSSLRLKKENIVHMQLNGFILNYPFNKEVNILLKKIWDYLKLDKEFQEKIMYRGIPLWGLARHIFCHLVFEVFRQKMHNLDLNRRIISAYRPKFIVVSNNMQETISMAKSFSIPVMAMQCASPEEFFCYGPFYADIVNTDGKRWKELLTNNGIPENKIVITGPPKFDSVFKRKDSYTYEDRKRFFYKMGLNENEKLVVWAGSHTDSAFGLFKSQYTDMVFSLFNIAKRLNGAQLLVKLHPYEFDFKLYKEIANRVGLNNLIVVKDIDKWELLFNCDLLITFFSMISYDAVIIDRPVINLQYFDNYLPGILVDDVWHLKSSDAAIYLDSFSDLQKYIEEILFNPEFCERLRANRRRYVESHLSSLGEASVFVKKAIEEFANDRHILDRYENACYAGDTR